MYGMSAIFSLSPSNISDRQSYEVSHLRTGSKPLSIAALLASTNSWAKINTVYQIQSKKEQGN